MKELIKYAAIGVAGYLLGRHEMKYKIVKIIAERKLDEESK